MLKDRYPIATALRTGAAYLGIDPNEALRLAGLTPEHGQDDSLGVTAAQYFAIWEAVTRLTGDFDKSLGVIKQLAKGPFEPALFAFTCSANIATGFERLALFKPLVAPVRLKVWRDEPGGMLHLAVSANTPDGLLPTCMAEFDLAYFIECCRVHTTHHIVPAAATVPRMGENTDKMSAFLGVEITQGPQVRLSFNAQDAERPLVSENPQLWSVFERDLTRQLQARSSETPMRDRVRTALLELLPGGRATSADVSRHLNTSKRSLQRRLSEEGVRFQTILAQTREELALHYLRQPGLAVEEISYLLAYGDPNSFYRAFHGWTGMTPAQARGAAGAGQGA